MSNAKEYKPRTKALVRNNIDTVILGSLIKKKRKEAGLKGTELAKLIGSSPQTLSGYESGSSSVSGVNLIKLCIVFNCDFMAFKEAFKFNVKEYCITRRVVVSRVKEEKLEVREITFKEEI